MRRIRTKEIHEKSWCPELFRDSLTEFLSIIWTIGVYKQAAERMKLFIEALQIKTVIDLCSGAGDYIPGLLKVIREGGKNGDLLFYKTDLFPNKKFFRTEDEMIRYWQEPLAADQAFGRFDGLFCMFSALHHFDEPELLKMFCRAASNNKKFSFFDISQRRFFTDILPNIFLPGMLWCTAPFFKRFTWKHFVFIYLIPVIPLIVFIDGTLSRMRAYNQQELQNLADRVEKRYPMYRIKIRQHILMGGLQKVTEIAGAPAESFEEIENFSRKER